jgi:hypothetical protein
VESTAVSYPLCRCPVATTFPVRCPCLHLQVQSPEMAAILRGESPPNTTRRTRSEWISGWLRIQRPTIPVTAARVGEAVGSIVSTTLGRHRVDDAERDRRRAICDACPTDQLVDGQCQACSCIVSRKSFDSRQFCPHGHW